MPTEDTSGGATRRRVPAGLERRPPLGRADRWRLALQERLPAWLQGSRWALDRRAALALLLLCLFAGGYAGWRYWQGRPQRISAPTVHPTAQRDAAHGEDSAGPTETSDTGSTGGQHGAVPSAPARASASGRAQPSGQPVVVDVAGKVRHPGVLHLPAGSRVADAIKAAGGIRGTPDTSPLNRARVLTDGEQVRVGGTPAPAPGPGAGAGGGGDAAPSTGAGGPASAAPGGTGPPTPVSLGTATVEQLQTLPGVGPVLAQHILDYREEHGGFRSTAQLKDVSGIGEHRFADLKPLVRP